MPTESFYDGQVVFERFGLSRKLGQGGMGEVWLATDVLLEKRVALKFLPGGLVRDIEAYELLKREAQKAMLVTHPNIVRVHDFHRTKDLAAISMEYVDGLTLTSLKEDRPNGIFEPHELQLWVGQLCEALHYAHSKVNLVHRDLKPANLMIDRKGDLKITDFGLSAHARPPDGAEGRARHVSGTLVYMSPQQLTGCPCQPSDDIYSLGATLFDLLSGLPPFYEGDIPSQIIRAVPQSIRARREQFLPEASPIAGHWEAVIARCLSKDPAERPESAKDVAIRLLNQPLAPVPPAAKSAPDEGQLATDGAEFQHVPASEEASVHSLETAAKGRGGLWIALAAVVLVLGVIWQLNLPEDKPARPEQVAAPAVSSAVVPPAPPASSTLVPTPTPLPVPVPESPVRSLGTVLDSRADWVAFCGVGRFVFVDRAAKELCVWTEQGGGLQRLPLSDSPVCETYSNVQERVYLGYSDGRITQVALPGAGPSKETPFTRHPVEPTALLSLGKSLLVASSENRSWSEHYLYDGGGRRMDLRKQLPMSHHLVWSAKHRRVYFLSEGQSPVDIYFEEVATSGKFAKAGDSPYHDSTGMSWPVKLLGRSESVVLGSGRVFNPLKLDLEFTLPKTVRYLSEQEDGLYVIAGATNPWGAEEPKAVEVLKLGQDYRVLASLSLNGVPLGIGTGHAGPVVVSRVEGRTVVYLCDKALKCLP